MAPAHLPTLLLAFGMPGMTEWIIILVIGLLFFGRRLPEVGRSLGRTIVEFKRGIKDIDDDIESESAKPAARISDRAATPAAHMRDAEPGGVTATPGDHRGA